MVVLDWGASLPIFQKISATSGNPPFLYLFQKPIEILSKTLFILYSPVLNDIFRIVFV